MAALGEEFRPSAAERATNGRPGQFKATRGREAEAARRREALAVQQSEARANRIDDVRRIAMQALLGSSTQKDIEEQVEIEEDDDDEADEDMGQGTSTKNAQKLNRLRKLHRTLFFARQLQVPDWLLDVPDDLASAWLMMVRPEGDRCLLLSDGGHVEIRRKNGYVLERYTDSRMPRGLTILDVVCMEGPAKEEAAPSADSGMADVDVDADAIADAPMQADCDEADTVCGVGDAHGGYRGRGSRGRDGGRGKGFSAKGGKGSGGKGRRGRPVGDRSYAVCDVLVWGDADLVAAEAECRMFWLESRFAEMCDKPSRRARALQLIPSVPVTAEAFLTAYQSDVGYVKDSFVFMHRQGHYGISEPVTPLVLLWRDRHVSRFVIDTPDAQGKDLPDRQAVVLEVRGSGHLRTGDHVIVGQLTEEQLAQAKGLVQGKDSIDRMLFRFEVQTVDLTARKLAGLEIKAHVAARSRVWADTWGRIAFQRLHRTGETSAISVEAVARMANGGVAATQHMLVK